MRKTLMGLVILSALGALVVQAWAACPAGTTYRCVQGYNGKVICSCS